MAHVTHEEMKAVVRSVVGEGLELKFGEHPVECPNHRNLNAGGTRWDRACVVTRSYRVSDDEWNQALAAIKALDEGRGMSGIEVREVPPLPRSAGFTITYTTDNFW